MSKFNKIFRKIINESFYIKSILKDILIKNKISIISYEEYLNKKYNI